MSITCEFSVQSNTRSYDSVGSFQNLLFFCWSQCVDFGNLLSHIFGQKFRENNIFIEENTKRMIWRNIFQMLVLIISELFSSNWFAYLELFIISNLPQWNETFFVKSVCLFEHSSKRLITHSSIKRNFFRQISLLVSSKHSRRLYILPSQLTKSECLHIRSRTLDDRNSKVLADIAVCTLQC